MRLGDKKPIEVVAFDDYHRHETTRTPRGTLNRVFEKDVVLQCRGGAQCCVRCIVGAESLPVRGLGARVSARAIPGPGRKVAGRRVGCGSQNCEYAAVQL